MARIGLTLGVLVALTVSASSRTDTLLCEEWQPYFTAHPSDEAVVERALSFLDEFYAEDVPLTEGLEEGTAHPMYSDPRWA